MLNILKGMLNSHNINLDKSEKFWHDRAEEFNNKAISDDRVKEFNDYETIIKMNEASKILCFMSGFVKRKDFLRDKLSSILLKEYDKNFLGNEIYKE